MESVACSPQACLLSFEPGFGGLIVAITGPVAARLPDPKGTYEGRRIRARGVVGERGGRPRIEVLDAASIETLDGPRSASTILSASVDGRALVAGGGSAAPAGATPSPGAPAALAAQEAAARLGLPSVPGEAPDREAEVGVSLSAEMQLLRQEIAGLLGQVAALEDRVAALDDRLAEAEEALAAASGGGDGPAVGGLPSYVVPGSSSPTLHRVRRGWTAERVVRVFGEPLRVSGEAPGPVTWYYDQGRAVTIDRYGRVVSAVGF